MGNASRGRAVGAEFRRGGYPGHPVGHRHRQLPTRRLQRSSSSCSRPRRSAPTSATTCARGAVRGVQERDSHRRGRVLRPGVRRQHGCHAHDARLGRDEPPRRALRRAGPSPAWGWPGTGDLVATCTSEHSRNRRFGKLLAEGGTLEEFAAQTHMVAEGALACKTLKTLADCYDVELPITDVVRSIAWEGADPSRCGQDPHQPSAHHRVLRALARQSTPRQQGVDRGFTERASVLSHGRSAGTLVLANRKGGFDNLSERPSSRLSCEPPLSLTLSNLRRAVSMRTFPLLLCAHCIASLGSPQPKGGFFTPALRLPSTSTRPRRASPASRRRAHGAPAEATRPGL